MIREFKRKIKLGELIAELEKGEGWRNGAIPRGVGEVLSSAFQDKDFFVHEHYCSWFQSHHYNYKWEFEFPFIVNPRIPLSGYGLRICVDGKKITIHARW